MSAPKIEAWLVLTQFGHEFYLERRSAVMCAERRAAQSGVIPPMHHLIPATDLARVVTALRELVEAVNTDEDNEIDDRTEDALISSMDMLAEVDR